MELKDHWDSGRPHHPQILLCDIKIYILSIMYRSAATQNVSDLDLSRSLKVNRNGAIELPIYDFLLMFNTIVTWPNSECMRYKTSKYE